MNDRCLRHSQRITDSDSHYGPESEGENHQTKHGYLMLSLSLVANIAPFVAMPGAPFVASDRSVRSKARSPERSFLFLVAMPCVTSSLLFLLASLLLLVRHLLLLARHL